MPKASRNDEPLLRATRYAANPGFVLLVSFYLILRMNSLAQATAVSYLTLRVGWQRGDPPLCVPMSNTTDAESDTDIIYRVDCCGVQFELVPARCFFYTFCPSSPTTELGDEN